jgi:hypothetical protein
MDDAVLWASDGYQPLDSGGAIGLFEQCYGIGPQMDQRGKGGWLLE